MPDDIKDKIIQNSLKAADNVAFYETFWENYQRPLVHEGYDQARTEFCEYVIERFIGRRDIEILDFGCGTGWLSEFLSSWGNVTGIDFALKAIELAKNNSRHQVEFLVADPRSLRLGIPEGKVFDLVICSEVIEHVQHHEALLYQLWNFLRPDSWCLLTTPNGNIWRQYRRDERYRQFHQPVENWLGPHEVTRLLRKTGFKILRHEGWSAEYYGYTWLERHIVTERIQRNVKKVGLDRPYARLIQPISLFQLIFAQKTRTSRPTENLIGG